MGVFQAIESLAYEQVVFCHDADTGLKAIIAIHSTVLGPALGGTRFYPYANDDDALTDVLRLARGMTNKAAVAGLDLGGGKAVILGDPKQVRTDDLMRAYGRFVDALAGRYVTAEDVGTTQGDMDIIRTVTNHVAGTTAGSGDPSPATAQGVMAAMRSVAAHLWGDDSLEGKHVAVSGVGKVGSALVGHLAEAGARTTVADVNPMAVAAMVEAHGSQPVPPEKVHTVECDLFAPCALGAVLSADTIPELRCEAVVGSANNQLATPDDAHRMADAGILYAPDYVVNAGGLINIFEEIGGYDPDAAARRIATIGPTTTRVLERAKDSGITTDEAASQLADERLAAARGDHVIRRFE